MASIPLPALHLNPPYDPSQGIERVVQLRNLMQLGQMRQQQMAMGQQEMQQRGIQMQMQTQQLRDQQTVMQHMSQNPDSSFADAAKALRGKVTLGTYTTLMDTDATIRQKLAGATQSELGNIKAQHDRLQDIYNNVKNLSPEELAAQTPQIAQQINSIPGAQFKVDPSQPLTPDKLTQAGTMLGLNENYIKAETAKREAGAKAAETEQHVKFMQQYGTATPTDQDKFVANYLETNNLPNTPQNRFKGQQEYIKETKINPAQVRGEFFLQRPTEVLDPNNPGQTIVLPAKQAFGMPGKGSVSQKALGTQASKAQQQFVAFDTADQHLQLIEKAGTALRNGDIQALNQVANWYGVQVGKDPVTTFKALTTVAAPEIVRASAGSGQMSEREIDVARNNFDPKLSPQQITSNVAAMRGLMAGKKAALQKNLTELQSGNVKGGAPMQAPGAGGGQAVIYARDPQGNLHSAPAGTKLPQGWKLEENR